MRKTICFATISEIILENRMIGTLSEVEYFNDLFEYALLHRMQGFDDSNISAILTGGRGVPEDICLMYQHPKSEEKMREAMEGIVTVLVDSEYVKEQVFNLLRGDITISRKKKKELSSHYNDTARFLTHCMVFALSRGSKTKRKKSQNIMMEDYILEYRLPSIKKNFFGRDNELAEIHKLLLQEHCVFIEGIGGIGKSELAKHYAYKYKKSYSNILYLSYNVSLRRTITLMRFVDDQMDMSDEERFENHYSFFHLLDEKTLVLLDNFNSVPEEDELFHDFLNMNFQVLVTTRSHIEDAVRYEIKEISNIKDLKKLFCVYASVIELYLSLADDDYFGKGFYYDGEKRPHELHKYLHMGMFQDSVLLEYLSEDPFPRTVCRYFPVWSGVEFYDTLYHQQDYSTPMLIHNTGKADLPVRFEMYPYVWTIKPGESKRVIPFDPVGAD